MGNAASFTFRSKQNKPSSSSAPKKKEKKKTRRNTHASPTRKGSRRKRDPSRASSSNPPGVRLGWGPVPPRAAKRKAEQRRKAFRQLWTVDRASPECELTDEKRKSVGQWVEELPDPFTDIMNLEPLPEGSLCSISGSTGLCTVASSTTGSVPSSLGSRGGKQHRLPIPHHVVALRTPKGELSTPQLFVPARSASLERSAFASRTPTTQTPSTERRMSFTGLQG
eukprot:Hpha_TRINITY_DN13640_c0_g1::TRINITY_DN13640_c0_g1_i2::g.122638::m.122638